MAGSADIRGKQHYVAGIGHPASEPSTEAPPAMVITNQITGEIENVSSGSKLYFGPARIAYAPWKLASYGDSRANVNSTSPDVSGANASLSVTKGPTWTAACRKDTELVFNYGVSGDLASAWAAAARTGGKTFSSFVSSGVDICHIQYGVNDILTGNGVSPSAATIVGHLKSVVMESVKTGIAVVFESILPCSQAGWVSAGGGTAAQKQAIADAVNDAMRAWIATVAGAVYADTATKVKQADGFADLAYYIDQIHLNNVGGFVSGETCSEASLALLPRKVANYYPGGLAGPNFVDSFTPPITTILSGVAGTFTLNSQTLGQDKRGAYVEWVITPQTLASGEATFWAAIGADVAGFSATPKYPIASSDVLQGQCSLVIDNGFGAASPGLRNFVVRHRCYYQAGGGVFADFGSYAVPSGQGNFGRVIDVLTTAPRCTTSTASSGIEAATHVKGYGLHLYVSVSTLDTLRIRVYNPMLRKAA